LRAAWAALLTLVAMPAAARAEPLLIREPAWNGLSKLAELARAGGMPTGVHAPVRVADLDAKDSLLIVHPTSALPVSELAAFLRRGGRLAVADDFGRGEGLLRTFGMGRSEPDPSIEAASLRGNRGLLLAKRQSEHPLSQDVLAIATNHPAVLFHRALSPVFALGEQRGAVVLSGAVGDGRLVAISDSSVLINNMLQLDDNRRFAENLLRYLRAERGGRLYLADSETRWIGSAGAFDAQDPLRSISDVLARVAVVELPRPVVVALTAMFVVLLVLWTVHALPRRAAYERRAIETPECRAGFAGRVRHAERKRGDYTAPLLMFRDELESQLLHNVGLPARSTRRRELLSALRKQRMSQAEVDATQRLLEELDALQLAAQSPTLRVSRRKFATLADAGRRILASSARRARADAPRLSP
jgi:hypothetical protein